MFVGKSYIWKEVSIKKRNIHREKNAYLRNLLLKTSIKQGSFCLKGKLCLNTKVLLGNNIVFKTKIPFQKGSIKSWNSIGKRTNILT